MVYVRGVSVLSTAGRVIADGLAGDDLGNLVTLQFPAPLAGLHRMVGTQYDIRTGGPGSPTRRMTCTHVDGQGVVTFR